MSNVRVRFAPSPTGGLHLGGIRTVLYNYLFAKNQGGKFILRIEDTDQSRYVAGAEEYIMECLQWLGIEPDESPAKPGSYGPYRQSERKAEGLYQQYAEQLVRDGHAYYAFDTPEELEAMRQQYKSDINPSPQYDHRLRMGMRNSLSLDADTTQRLLDENTRYVIRIKMPENETIGFTDMIRGEVNFETGLVDDKVLLKADGMPTYHLAVVVDDKLMEITHAFRGEEWLPSAPVHVLLWKYLFGLDQMPQWAHLPLILGPNGKLSKRDGAKYGFPVFAMNWTDAKTNELTEGFREKGFLPEAFINLLALLGWNDGTEKELFSLDELIKVFSMDRVHSAGAKFDYEKARWFNHEWIKAASPERLAEVVLPLLKADGIDVKEEAFAAQVIAAVKDRCTLLPDFITQTSFFFRAPISWDLAAVKPKWNTEKERFFELFSEELDATPEFDSAFIEEGFKKTAALQNIKAGELQLPFRIMLVGGKFGPPVFDIAAIIGKTETISRIKSALKAFVE
ncbi:MAG: glutamate--tRNA ligase [Chitinophagaceae bacterium]|nr:MAG: glutamate--tRNA ligase [Chitinophagaceae bacterium]